MQRVISLYTAILLALITGCTLEEMESGSNDVSEQTIATNQLEQAIVNGQVENGFTGAGAMTLYISSGRGAYFGNFCSGTQCNYTRW